MKLKLDWDAIGYYAVWVILLGVFVALVTRNLWQMYRGQPSFELDRWNIFGIGMFMATMLFPLAAKFALGDRWS